ncbi:MAG TPA: RNA polymerase sigma factor [Puia sp.]|jgi:RNA polymerase sigma-70 factor (ECF subfamily)|nr:RNA polymerase sigma factor [Puia sp.]
MLKVKSGDLDKMALLFQRYHRPLYAFLYHMTGQREASEDMGQTVFYRLLKSRHTFTGEGEFKTWMYHVARNVLSDHYKGSRRPVVDIAGLEDKLSGDTGLFERVEKRLAVQALQKAMAALSPESREILILSRFQELKGTEIAGILDISVGAVKVRIFRAISQLKTLYLKQQTEIE